MRTFAGSTAASVVRRSLRALAMGPMVSQLTALLAAQRVLLWRHSQSPWLLRYWRCTRRNACCFSGTRCLDGCSVRGVARGVTRAAVAALVISMVAQLMALLNGTRTALVALAVSMATQWTAMLMA